MKEFVVQTSLEDSWQAFLSEYAQGLDLIEQGLHVLEQGHGGTWLTGGAALSDFGQVLETLLDRVRVQELQQHLLTVLPPPARPAAAQAPSATIPRHRSLMLPLPHNTRQGAAMRVETGKLDHLMNLVGELVINQAMLREVAGPILPGGETIALGQRLAQIESTTSELQHTVVRIRTLPLAVVLRRLPPLVQALGKRLCKQVVLKMSGEDTELDRAVLEKLCDPLLHLVINALDHGLESAEERTQRGKPQAGEIRLDAAHEGSNVVIRVRDDGRGLDSVFILQRAIERGLVEATELLPEHLVFDLIFRPGFTTLESVRDPSGRGIGMDTVRRSIEAVGGRVEVRSQSGLGCCFEITLPRALSIVDAQMLRVASQVFALPLLSIIATEPLRQECIKVLAGSETVYCLRDMAVPLVDLARRLGVAEAAGEAGDKQLVVVEAGRHRIGLIVDELLERHQVVIKSLDKNFVKVDWMLGASILGDGSLAFILDVAMLVDDPGRDSRHATHH